MTDDKEADRPNIEVPGDIRLAFMRKFGPVKPTGLTDRQKKWVREQLEERGLM